jgi:methyl-accepting chemotaxis protein
MKNWIQQTSLVTKLRATAFGTVLVVLALCGYLLWTTYIHSRDDRQTATRQAVQTAYSVLVWAHSQEQAGTLTREQAQQQARAAIKQMRYAGTEYFWLQDMQPRMVMHPIKPELDGKDLSEMKDPDGVYLFKEFVKVAREHDNGFVSYMWPKPGHEQPQPKQSYVMAFKPWGWVIGSGVYIDDLRATFWSRVAQFAPVMAAAAALLFFIINSLARSITRRIQRAVNLAEAIASGNIQQEVRFRVNDEIGALMVSLKRMCDSLNDTVGRVRHSADSMATASAQIAAGSQDLSVRTEQTAARLQQTSSSIVSLSSRVQENSEASRTANQLADSARTAASRGSDVVAQVVNTMDDINQSSRKITDIISVIDGIAFQTNILALNAAVEAARAGEQGRGFAVVASEVRSLAQRSANAAREIKSLIINSTERVETGSKLVQETGTVMSDILDSVQRVTDIIGEISTSAAEQANGIGTVNHAVSQLDGMTQQNAALVEQSAAAAASMQEQARTLAEVVSRFKLLDKASLDLMSE